MVDFLDSLVKTAELDAPWNADELAKGHPRSAETRAKLSVANKGHPQIIAANSRRSWSPASLAKLSASLSIWEHEFKERPDLLRHRVVRALRSLQTIGQQ